MGTVQTILEISPELKGIKELRDLLVEASQAARDIRSTVAGLNFNGGSGGGGGGAGGGAGPTPGGTGYNPNTGGGGGGPSTGGGGSGVPGFPGTPPAGMPPASLWQRIMFGNAVTGKAIGGLGSLGIGGMMLQGSLRTTSSAMQSYFGQEAIEQGGLVSGSLSQALSGVAAASYNRQKATQQAVIGGGGGAIGGAGMVAGGMLMTNPGTFGVGLALMIGGALVSAGSQVGSAAANSFLSVLQAKEQAAFGFYEDVYQKRTQLARTGMKAIALGGEMPSDSEMFSRSGGRSSGLGYEFGYSPQEIAQQSAEFAQAGGHGLSTRFRLAADRGLGLGSGSLGSYISALSGGQASFGFAPSTGAGMPGENHLNRIIANAIGAGISKAKLGDYLSRIASTNEAMVSRGLAMSDIGIQRNLGGLTTAGFTPMQAASAAQNVNQYGSSLLSEMGEQRLPSSMVRALVKRTLLQKYGSWDAAMTGLEGELQTGEAMTTMAGIQSGLPDELQAPFGMAITGMFPTMAKKFGSFAPGEGMGGPDVYEAAKAVTGAPEFQMLQMAATREGMQTMAQSIQQINAQFDLMVTLLEKQTDNLRERFPAAIDRLLTELGGAASTRRSPTGYNAQNPNSPRVGAHLANIDEHRATGSHIGPQ